MGRSDPALTYLKQYGFSVVRLPRADIPPGLLLERDGRDLTDLGGLETVFVAGNTTTPKITLDEPAAQLSGQIRTTLSLGLGLSLLEQFLRAFGGSSAGLEAQYQQAKSLSFEFDEVFTDSIEPAALEQFLSQADVDPRSVNARRLLDEDRVYVVTRTLKANRFLVEGQKDSKAGVQVNLPAIRDIVGGSVTVATEGQSKSKLSFAGGQRLVFGLQAVRLMYEGGSFVAYKSLPPGSAAKRAPKKGTKTAKAAKTTKIGNEAEYLVAEGAFVNIGK
jgi:hypothetical protein